MSQWAGRVPGRYAGGATDSGRPSRTWRISGLDDEPDRAGSAGVKAVAYWDRLKPIYLNPRNPAEDLVRFVNMKERGESRIWVVRPIRRIGRQRTQDLLEQLRTDPVLGVEPTSILKGRSRNS